MRTSDPFQPGRALRGTRGHQELQRKRPDSYRPEVAIRYSQEFERGSFRVYGRIDGIDHGHDPLQMEEIKTVTRYWNGRPRDLDWAQLRFYAGIYAETEGVQKLALKLTYYNLDTGWEESFEEVASAETAMSFSQETIRIYGEWLEDYWKWCEERDGSVATYSFPFATQRRGQGELMDAVASTIDVGGRIFIEAATGLGKTVSVLDPAIRALASGKVNRVFYLSAKNTGKAAAEKALRYMRDKGLRLRSLNLRSRTETCAHHGKPCDVEICPFATNYYEQNKEAMRVALELDQLNGAEVAKIGERFSVCPFALALDLMPFVDLVICDYHYVFDQQSMLERALESGNEKPVLLVDECHNLVERGREMFSAALSLESVENLQRKVSTQHRALHRAIDRISGLFSAESTTKRRARKRPAEQQMLFGETIRDTGEQAESVQDFREGAVEIGVPGTVVSAITRLLDELAQWLALQPEIAARDELLEVYFSLQRFTRLAEFEAGLFRFYQEGARNAVWRLYCVDPAPLLRESIGGFQATVFFSGTLTPLETFSRLLGGRADDQHLQIGSPFPPDNQIVRLHTHVDTRLRVREKNYPMLLETLWRSVWVEEGSYLVFFPSYEYLYDVVSELRKNCLEDGWSIEEGYTESQGGEESDHAARELPRMLLRSPQNGDSRRTVGANGIECLWQVAKMDQGSRESFIRRFSCSPIGTVIGFVVLGGVFSEGIDVDGEGLRGVAIVGVGYPKICRERDLLSEYFDQDSTSGFEMAYLVPGMNRVVQAAGRLHRKETDRGVIHLIDRRYQQLEYRRLLPSWWREEDGFK